MLSDILLNSVYDESAIWRERGVILREAEEVEQNMQEVVFDHLHDGAFKGCSLSRTILGTTANIRFVRYALTFTFSFSDQCREDNSWITSRNIIKVSIGFPTI